jgi:predicted nucleotidyltransferase
LKRQDDKVLTRFRAAVMQIYGDRIERVVLFGSRTRGEAKPDSDYNIAVYIKDPATFTDESARLAAVTTDIPPDTGAGYLRHTVSCGSLSRTYWLHA